MSKTSDRMLELAGIDPLLTEAKNNDRYSDEEKYMYSVLTDVVLDAITEGLTKNF